MPSTKKHARCTLNSATGRDCFHPQLSLNELVPLLTMSSKQSVEPELKFRVPVPERLGPLKTKHPCIICSVGLLHKLRLLNQSSNFRLRLHHSKIFDSGSSHPKLLGLRLHNPASKAANYKRHQEVLSSMTWGCAWWPDRENHLPQISMSLVDTACNIS